ncbi:MAG: hypothetical protein ACTHOB_12840 [Ginsengibacter sp.]
MKSIFLSRPNWIPSECRDGLNNFLSLLKSHELEPRTIGATDYPSKSPMDAVIDLLYECEGAIILGYPQIQITAGSIKDKTIEKLIPLSTEWNHIEAGLAHALGLPLFIIHDTNISRGIFDRGVLNYFLYEKDFCDNSWGISPDIAGALTKWKSQLKPISRIASRIINKEKPTVKWGCYQFLPDETLYCPFCYNKDGEKMVTTRYDMKFRQCTNCERKISTG